MQLKEAVTQEAKLQEALIQIQGCLEPVLCASMMSGLSITV